MTRSKNSAKNIHLAALLSACSFSRSYSPTTASIALDTRFRTSRRANSRTRKGTQKPASLKYHTYQRINAHGKYYRADTSHRLHACTVQSESWASRTVTVGPTSTTTKTIQVAFEDLASHIPRCNPVSRQGHVHTSCENPHR
jgi:hypothetical protein